MVLPLVLLHVAVHGGVTPSGDIGASWKNKHSMSNEYYYAAAQFPQTNRTRTFKHDLSTVK